MNNTLINSLWQRRREGRPLIAAHRGTEGGNIIQNTARAYKNAIAQHADIIETDVAKSKDGIFYMFHTGQEERVFGFDCSIENLTSKEIDEMYLINGTFDRVNQRISKFEDIVLALSEKVYITIDRSWFYWEDFLRYIVDKEFSDKIIVKAPVTAERLAKLAEIAPNLNFMAIIKTQECLQMAYSFRDKINLVGLEVIFSDKKDALASKEFIKHCHKENLLLWVNALNVNDETILAGGLDDDTSVLDSADKGWGELIQMDFDIIQTDWPLSLSVYITEKGEKDEKSS